MDQVHWRTSLSGSEKSDEYCSDIWRASVNLFQSYEIRCSHDGDFKVECTPYSLVDVYRITNALPQSSG
jgi:hypothetical protein